MDRTMTCKAHGEVEGILEASGSLWCPVCREDAIKEAMQDPEVRRKVAEAMQPKPISMGTTTCVKPHGIRPPIMTDRAEGIHPPYQEHYIRRTRFLDDE